jgi:Ca2+-binding EF-hand superfamily protein
MRRFFVAGALSVLALVAGMPGSASAEPGQPQRPRVQAQQRRAAVRQRAARIVRQRWQRMDTDGSGTITRNEWRGRPAAFDRLDRNRDGVLTKGEFGRGVRRAARRIRG